MELLAVLLVYTIFAAAVPWMHFPGTPHTAGHKRLSVDSDSSSTAAPRSYYVSVVETKTKTTTVTALASLPSRPYSVTKNVTTADKPKTKTMWYPAESPNVCVEGPNRRGHGEVCKNKCMRRYLTPKKLPPVTWLQNGTLAKAALTWSLPRWGDADGNHVPRSTQISELMRSADTTFSWTTPPPIPGKSKASSKATKTTTLTSIEAFAPFSYPPRMIMTFTQCEPTKSDAHYSKVPVGGGPTATAWMTPTNPLCDSDDPTGWSPAEKAWLFQNQKPRGGDKKDPNKGHIECYNFESCWDHCQRVQRNEDITKWALIGVFILLALLLVIAVLVVKCLQKKRRNQESQKDWGNESSQAPAEQAPQQVDGVADDDDERSARRAAALFTVNRREAVATGSEALPDQEGFVRRA
ncbi:hypothetical protein GTA08_BOTSDO05471 [Botryosphaeria dothidea]|uniref:Integral membrane protein n=1 Tax=Botryosphaeria dothidea TaxID=55169 RepID=A0A8H4ITL0_9PEZI|nr:hypothetical protein GTA08_BOTSDO05471 [Botryosphaeria dothidea]